MQLNYYKYYIADGNNNRRHDLAALVEAYASLDDGRKSVVRFKRSITTSGGNPLVIEKLSGRTYLFMELASYDILYSVSQDLKKTPIQDLIGNDQIGFVSFVHFAKDGFIGIASTQKGPGVTYLAKFFDQIFESIGKSGYVFSTVAFQIQISPDKAKELPFLGKVEFDIGPSSNPVKHWFSKTLSQDGGHARVLRISVLPQARENMNNDAKELIDNFSDDAISMKVWGKEALGDALTEFVIAGYGHLRDTIHGKTVDAISKEIPKRIDSNLRLRKLAHEFKNDGDFLSDLPGVSRYYKCDAWDRIISSH